MGDLCDQADIERFLRSPEGRAHVEKIQQELVGRKITNAHFTNQVHFVGIGIVLEDGGVFECQQPELDVDRIREDFDDALDREYYVDYPERNRS